MTTSLRWSPIWLALWTTASLAQTPCDPRDPTCRQSPPVVSAPAASPATVPADASASVSHRRAGGQFHALKHRGLGELGSELQPVRSYLSAKDIPPANVGAYGLVVFHSKATSANRAKLKMVCNSFVAFFPRSKSSTAAPDDQMVTVWPLDKPTAKQAKEDDCDYVVDHYDLAAAEDAIRDAEAQHASLDGAGPYLVGWSPSKARGVPNALVLVVDLSADNSQATIDAKFLFWKNKIIEDPSLWRNGFSIEQVRVAIHDFAEQYGQAMLDAIKLVGGDKKP